MRNHVETKEDNKYLNKNAKQINLLGNFMASTRESQDHKKSKAKCISDVIKCALLSSP